jgi:hypothetical protein
MRRNAFDQGSHSIAPLVDERRDLLVDDRSEAVGEGVRRLAGRQHRLVEWPAALPVAVARDGQRVGLEVRHPLPLCLRVGGEGVGRALEQAPHVGDVEEQQGGGGPEPYPHRRAAVGSAHSPQETDRPAVDVGARRRADRPPPAPEEPLDSVRHHDERVEGDVVGEGRARQLAGAGPDVDPGDGVGRGPRESAEAHRGRVSRPDATVRTRSLRPRAPARAPDGGEGARRPSCSIPPIRCPRACRRRGCSRW